MKIILINNLFEPYQKGGAERIVEITAKELKDLGHEVTIISTYPKGQRKIEQEQAGVYYLASSYRNLADHSALFRLQWQLLNLINFKKYREVATIFKNTKADLIITHNLMGLGLLIPLAIYKNKAKHLHVLHDIQLLHPAGLMYYGQENILTSLGAKVYQKITQFLFSLSKNKIIISPSKWLLDLHQQHGLFASDKNFVISNPILKTSLPTDSNKEKVFTFVGQLEKHKGVDLFISVATFFPNYTFKLIGDGSLLETIKRQKINNLEILGRKSSEQVLEIFKSSAAVIIPSRCYENSPTVIYEAYSVGTPTIAANLGGIPELITKFGGLLFTPDNLESLKETINSAISQEIVLKNIPPDISYSEKLINCLN